MGLLKLAKALPTCDLPHKYLTTLAAGGKHFAVPVKIIRLQTLQSMLNIDCQKRLGPRECEAENGVLHQHEVLSRLVLQVLPDLASREIPNLNNEKVELILIDGSAFTSINPSTLPDTRYCPSGLNAADSM